VRSLSLLQDTHNTHMAERILANLEQTVQQARREGRWADASV